MPAPRDDELAVIFSEMRRASERPLEALADRLGTTPATLVALESGEIAALPEWGETSRVVAAYTAMLHLDGRPVLRRLEKQFSKRQPEHPPAPGAAASGGVTPGAAAAPSSQPQPPKAVKGPPLPPGAGAKPAVPAPAARNGADAGKMAARKETPPTAEGLHHSPVPAPERPVPAPGERAVAPRPEEAADITVTLTDRAPEERETAKPRRGRRGTIMTWVLLLAVFGVMGLGVRHAIQHPAAVWATVDSLPEPAPRVVRSVWELVRPPVDAPQPAPAADPQSQKTDRLPGAEAPQGN